MAAQLMETMDYDDAENEVEESEVELFGEKPARWFQIAARNAVEQLLQSNPMARILIHQPTGVGKTITTGITLVSNTVRLSVTNGVDRPLRVLFVAHRHRLLTQAEREYNNSAGIATVTEDNVSNTTMAVPVPGISKPLTANGDRISVEIYYQSAFSEIPNNIFYDIVVIDEVHHESCMTIQYRLDQMGDKPIIGLTATPDRPDGLLIKFDKIVNPISRMQAVEQGFLAPTSIYSFVDGSERNKGYIVKDILASYADVMGQTMIFLRTKKEVSFILDFLLSQNKKAVSITSQSNNEVDEILDSFSCGEVQFIVNCNKIDEGIDVKGCQTVLIGKTLGSIVRLNQIIGRAARPDSECNVYEIINPLSRTNLDTTVVVGTPESHKLIFKDIDDNWSELEFDYTSETLGDNLFNIEA
jgi:superfamily II DNA or RNA helicase